MAIAIKDPGKDHPRKGGTREECTGHLRRAAAVSATIDGNAFGDHRVRRARLFEVTSFCAF
jgi:hypothetical protein